MSAGIRAIDGESVHRIHSGQVVLDLQGALKELVENALDAGASSIEVRIRDNGLSSIEVVDNGSGIAEVDWPSIGLKHHTSKLPSLELLPSVSTFGFRGEALSALCALCEEVTVTTATKEMEPMGAVIKLGRDGKVIDNTGRVARPRGTTITLSGLFAPLPVRRKEFERNAKRELSKALTLLTAYALVPASTSATYDRSGVRLKVESTIGGNNGKGAKRSTLLSNDGRGDLRAAVVGVWGTKALEGVQEVDLGFEVPLDRMAQRVGQAGFKDTQSTQIPASRAVQQADGESEEENFKPAEACLLVKVTGLVSSASWGMGRSSADRQYFYINGRPVDAKPLQKALNEVYKSFNTHQVPLAVLDFRIPTDSIDINVSPDKRTILLHSEQNLLIAFRKALEGFFAPSRNSFAVNGATQTVRGLKMTQSTLALAGPSGTAAATGESAVGPGDGDNLRFADQGDDSAEPMQMDVDEATQSGNSRALGGSTHRTDPAVAGPSPFDLSSSRHAAQDAVPVESDTDSVVELERFDNSPVTRRPAQLLAPRSVPSRRTSNEPITVLDEEEEATGNGVPMGVRQSSEREPRSASARRLIPSAIPVPAIVGDKVEKSSVTVSTSSASWSPARKSASSQGRPQTSARASTTSAHAKTGKEARKSLRDRLAVYSQLPSRSGSSQAEQMRDNDEPADELGAGEEELEEREEEQDGQASTDINQVEVEEGEDELDELDEGEDVQMTATRTAARRKQSLPASPEILAIDADSDDDIPPGARGIGADVSGIENGQASDEERTKVRDDSPREDVGTTISQVPSRSRSYGHSGIASEVPLSRRYRDEIATQGSTGSMTVAFDFPAIQQRAAKRRRLMSALDASKAQRRVDLNARLAQAGVAAEAGIANRDLSSAEAALSRTVSKADFARMKVVGQFNKGFVIARCTSTAVNAKGTGEGEVGQDDLYIVDQHASDEKYNFETLQRETRIKAQKLIKPRSLQLTAADEIVAIENLDILKANGFEVDIDEEMPPGRGERVKLVAMPVSKETVFDYRDLEQLLHLLSDSAHSATTSGSGQGQMVRCTKARAMFAMRACRKSIMIGKSLTKPQMTQLLRNMGTIEQPWNCPHGRPTMRHLTAIDGSTAVTGRQEIDWSRWASEQDQ